MNDKKPGQFMTRMVVFMAVNITFFTVVWTVIYTITGMVPEAVVTGFYAFWGGEGTILAIIKGAKMFDKYMTSGGRLFRRKKQEDYTNEQGE